MHNSSNPSKNYFHNAVAKYKVLTEVPSKKYCNGVKMLSISKNIPESRDSCKPLYSGLKLNFSKCELLRIGSLRTSTAIDTKIVSLKWASNSVSALGVTFTANREDVTKPFLKLASVFT